MNGNPGVEETGAAKRLYKRLSEKVQDDIRLGLLPVSAGRELAKLPRGDQPDVAAAIIKYRFSTREAARLIRRLLLRPRWEYPAILASPWEIVEPKQPRPTGRPGGYRKGKECKSL